jgi:protoporphyrinogen oxidase
VNLNQAIKGSFEEASPVGYNVTYAYPIDGLNVLAQRMAASCDVRYGKRAARIDVDKKVVHFADGSEDKFELLISTLPLNTVMTMTGLTVDAEPDPYSSVLVLNIGARKGPKCPGDHWYYNPDARSRFHRVGFYSNVDRSFMPESDREDESSVSIYVERGYAGGAKPGAEEIATYCDDVVEELQDWGYIGKAEVVDPTWIDVAYTWAWPGSTWRAQALRSLEEHSIYMVGRYARWTFQGLADSIRDGFFTGACFKKG